MRNVVKLLLVLTMVFSLSFGVFADTQTNADLLAELNLLSGTGNGYDLEGDLTRAQAATFIVKLMGDQETVLTQSESVTAFSDVKGTEWFVPYVAYCYNEGIISGYPDGTFQPNKIVSEQEFLSMVLKVLNITDTAWTQIHAKAYGEGLITKSSVDTNFLRGDVVNIMANSLELSVEDTNQTVISRLVEKEVVSEDLAVSKGLMIKDEIKSDIKSFKVESNTEIRITMNEEIESLEVVILDEDNDLIDVKDVDVNKKYVTVKTSELAEEDYTIMLNEIEDKNGIVINGVEREFKGLPKVVKSNFFRISTVKAVSKNLVEVTFTHPVTSNTALVSNFTIKDDENDVVVEGDFETLASNVLASNDHVIQLWLKDYDLKDGMEYKLIVDENADSLYGSEINNGKDDSFEFVGTTTKNETFGIEDITVIKDGFIRIRFNQDLNTSGATSNSKYKLRYTSSDNSTSALDVTLTGTDEWEDREVTLKYVMSDNKEYELIIDKVENAFKEQEIEEEEYGFLGFPEVDDPEIEFASAIDENYVMVYFTEAIKGSDLDSATILVGGRAPEEIVFDSDTPAKVELFMSDSDRVDSDKTLTITGLDNILDENMGTLTFDVEGSNKEFDQVSISKATRISENQVLVEFNYAVDTNTSKSKFDFEYKDDDGDTQKYDADSVSFLDPYTAVVKCNDLELSEDYKMVIKDIYDVSGEHMTDEVKKTIE